MDEESVPREFVSQSKTDSRHLFSTHEFSSVSLGLIPFCKEFSVNFSVVNISTVNGIMIQLIILNINN